MLLRPPTHVIDAPGVFISAGDCWDNEKLDAEHQAALAKALRAKQDAVSYAVREAQSPEDDERLRASVELTEDEQTAALAATPFARYYAGRTRYQLDAQDWDAAGEPVTVRQYLTGIPTEFVLRRLHFIDFREASTITIAHKALLEMTTLGLVEIRSPAGGLQWKADKDTKRVPEAVLQSIHDAGHGLISEIGTAVLRYNRPLDDAEGKR
jgi:hypothetical protein